MRQPAGVGAVCPGPSRSYGVRRVDLVKQRSDPGHGLGMPLGHDGGWRWWHPRPQLRTPGLDLAGALGLVCLGMFFRGQWLLSDYGLRIAITLDAVLVFTVVGGFLAVEAGKAV
ncbi:MAG: hypothetical protein Q8R98_23665, partial [Rubrivivax sp.]|nr:hypothetical protein [Rubrivivax sp.]